MRMQLLTTAVVSGPWTISALLPARASVAWIAVAVSANGQPTGG